MQLNSHLPRANLACHALALKVGQSWKALSTGGFRALNPNWEFQPAFLFSKSTVCAEYLKLSIYTCFWLKNASLGIHFFSQWIVFFLLFTTTILILFPASQLYLIQIVVMSCLQLPVFLWSSGRGTQSIS